jgi:hypothetical protein
MCEQTDTIKKIIYKHPEISSNQLGDIYKWLNLGDVVMLRSKYVQYIYHDCNKHTAKCRYIIVDVNNFPSLLNEGEWPDFLNDAGKSVCKCNDIIEKLNTAIKERSPNVFRFSV